MAQREEGVKPTFYTLRTKLVHTQALPHESVKSRFDPVFDLRKLALLMPVDPLPRSA
jgi:hypothetical protein